MPLAALLAVFSLPVEAQMVAHDLMGSDPLARQIMRRAGQPGSGIETIVGIKHATGRIVPLRLDVITGAAALNGPRPIGAPSETVLSGLAIAPRPAEERAAAPRKTRVKRSIEQARRLQRGPWRP